MPTGMRDYDRWDGSEQTFLDTDDFSIVCIPIYISYQRFLFPLQDLLFWQFLKSVRVGNTE